MRLLFLLPLIVSGFYLGAQPESRLTSFYFELDLFVTHPTMIAESVELDNRFERGGGLNFSIRRKHSSLVSLEAGLGVQIFRVRQRNENIILGCNLPPVIGGAGAPNSYLDAHIELTSATMHLAPIFHLERDREGFYLKPKLRFNYNIGAGTVGDLYECGSDEATPIAIGFVSGRKLTFFPGLGIGYQGEGNRGKLSYLEINFALSTNEAYRKVGEDPGPLPGFWREGGALLGGITIGFQLGGGTKNNRKPKKERPATAPVFYSGR